MLVSLCTHRSHAHTCTPLTVPCVSIPALAQSLALFPRVLLDCSLFPRTHWLEREVTCPPGPPMLSPSLLCGLRVGGGPDQAASQRPQPLSLPEPPLDFLPVRLHCWHRAAAPRPSAPGGVMLAWAGGTATSQGAEVTGPKASHKSAAENSRFLLLGLRFLTALLAIRVLSTPAPPPPWQGPLNPNHVSVGVSQSCPGLAVVTRCLQTQVWACWPG